MLQFLSTQAAQSRGKLSSAAAQCPQLGQMARPGTIDYSKWERLAAEVSSDEDMPLAPSFEAPACLHAVQSASNGVDDAAENSEDDDMSCDDEGFFVERPLLTGTCASCGSEGASKRCSRCQAAWFCDQDCQAAAWKSQAISCFPRSETEAWWGKLNVSGSEVAARTRDAASQHQERLAVRRAVAATYQRKKAAQEAAAAAAAARAREGQMKGSGGKGGKGQEEKEETCAVCQCEFTVNGDSGEGLRGPLLPVIALSVQRMYRRLRAVYSERPGSFLPSQVLHVSCRDSLTFL